MKKIYETEDIKRLIAKAEGISEDEVNVETDYNDYYTKTYWIQQ